jgi:hypothetical protein
MTRTRESGVGPRLSHTVVLLLERAPSAIATDGDDVTVVWTESDSRDRERVSLQ